MVTSNGRIEEERAYMVLTQSVVCALHSERDMVWNAEHGYWQRATERRDRASIHVVNALAALLEWVAESDDEIDDPYCSQCRSYHMPNEDHGPFMFQPNYSLNDCGKKGR